MGEYIYNKIVEKIENLVEVNSLINDLLDELKETRDKLVLAEAYIINACLNSETGVINEKGIDYGDLIEAVKHFKLNIVIGDSSFVDGRPVGCKAFCGMYGSQSSPYHIHTPEQIKTKIEEINKPYHNI